MPHDPGSRPGSAPDADTSGALPRFHLAFAPGTTPGKWVRTWEKRMPHVPIELKPSESGVGLKNLRAGEVDAALVRLPVDRDGQHAIPLYTEATVVVMPKDHTLTLAESLTPEDLADETVQHPVDDVLDWAGTDGPPGIPAFERPATTPAALDLVAAGVGLTLMPQSMARLHHRKSLAYRPIEDPADGSIPQSTVALVWPERPGGTPELVEEFIGIVRGRTPNSSRGTGGRTTAGEKSGKTAARSRKTGTRKPDGSTAQGGGRARKSAPRGGKRTHTGRAGRTRRR